MSLRRHGVLFVVGKKKINLVRIDDDDMHT
jgi:hypothetical protein